MKIQLNNVNLYKGCCKFSIWIYFLFSYFKSTMTGYLTLFIPNTSLHEFHVYFFNIVLGLLTI